MLPSLFTCLHSQHNHHQINKIIQVAGMYFDHHDFEILMIFHNLHILITFLIFCRTKPVLGYTYCDACILQHSTSMNVTHQRAIVVSKTTGVNMRDVVIIFLDNFKTMLCVFTSFKSVFLVLLNIVPPEDEALSTETCWDVCKKT
jgi:hypothetical protein